MLPIKKQIAVTMTNRHLRRRLSRRTRKTMQPVSTESVTNDHDQGFIIFFKLRVIFEWNEVVKLLDKYAVLIMTPVLVLWSILCTRQLLFLFVSFFVYVCLFATLGIGRGYALLSIKSV